VSLFGYGPADEERREGVEPGTPIEIDRLCQLLGELAPLGLAESWDNVGLLIGDRRRPVRRVMTCLTITPQVVREAIGLRTDLIVAHHPFPFKPLSRITADTPVGSMLLELIAGGVAVYSAHTAFDSAVAGINQCWAEGLGLKDIRPLIPVNASAAAAAIGGRTGPASGASVKPPAFHSLSGSGLSADSAGLATVQAAVGGGRCGRLVEAVSLEALADRAARFSGTGLCRIVGSGDDIVNVGVACGSGGGFLSAAEACGCQALITGEATFHTCLEAEAIGVGLVLVGHYASERFAMEHLAGTLATAFRQAELDLQVYASVADSDPLRTMPPADREH